MRAKTHLWLMRLGPIALILIAIYLIFSASATLQSDRWFNLFYGIVIGFIAGAWFGVEIN